MITLDDYQLASCSWLKQRTHRILADAPGVGKTHPAIFACKDLVGPKLVVCPAYLLTNWEAELENSGEKEIVRVNGGPRSKRYAILLPAQWTIVSYETFAKTEYSTYLKTKYWAAVIFDEAHALKNRNSIRTKAAKSFRYYTERMYMLTGTPIRKSGGDVFTLLQLCDPKEFSSYWRFVDTTCKISMTPWGKKVGKPLNKAAFTEMLRPYMMRRTLEEIFPEMPAVLYQNIQVDLDEKDRSKYKLAKKDYLFVNPAGKKTRIGAGGLLSALRTITVSAKDEALLGILDDIDEDEQVVIFAWYRNTIDHIKELLPDVAAFHGGVGPTEREDIIEDFKSGKSKVLVATLSTMKEGVNLQNANHVIFFEEDWVTATNEQALARLHRRGQTKTVLAYNIIVRNSVDSRVHKATVSRGLMGLENIFDEEIEDDS